MVVLKPLIFLKIFKVQKSSMKGFPSILSRSLFWVSLDNVDVCTQVTHSYSCLNWTHLKWFSTGCKVLWILDKVLLASQRCLHEYGVSMARSSWSQCETVDGWRSLITRDSASHLPPPPLWRGKTHLSDGELSIIRHRTVSNGDVVSLA